MEVTISHESSYTAPLSFLAGRNATFLVALIWSNFLPRSEPQSQSTDRIRLEGGSTRECHHDQ